VRRKHPNIWNLNKKNFLLFFKEELQSSQAPSMSSVSAWTNYMVHWNSEPGDRGVLARVADIFDMEVDSEMRLDQCWFKYTGRDKTTWKIEAAIEHENDWRTIHDELCKLLHLSPIILRVGFFYPDKIGIPHQQAIKEIEDLIAGLATGDEMFLVIFGAERDDEIEWTVYDLVTNTEPKQSRNYKFELFEEFTI
jgi:hypothetical protein